MVRLEAPEGDSHIAFVDVTGTDATGAVSAAWKISRPEGAPPFRLASRKNDDGTVSFITIEPTLDGFEFVVGAREGKRALIIRDAQHEYYFVET